MTANEYQRLALRTANPRLTITAQLINGLLGIAGEGGEAADILKKHLYQDHHLDQQHLAKELGDLCWYIALTASAIGYDLDHILESNIKKLEARYPDGFDPTRSMNREEDDV